MNVQYVNNLYSISSWSIFCQTSCMYLYMNRNPLSFFLSGCVVCVYVCVGGQVFFVILTDLGSGKLMVLLDNHVIMKDIGKYSACTVMVYVFEDLVYNAWSIDLQNDHSIALVACICSCPCLIDYHGSVFCTGCFNMLVAYHDTVHAWQFLPFHLLKMIKREPDENVKVGSLLYQHVIY